MRSALAFVLPLLLAAAPVSAPPGKAAAPARPAAKPAPGVSALKGHDTHAPIDIDAARVEVHDNDNQAIFTGTVHAVQGDMTLDSQSLKVFYEKKDNSDPEIQRIDAQGNVKMTSPTETARGNYGIYDVVQRTITLIGSVILNQNDNVLHGQRLVMDLDTGRSTLDGGTGGNNGTKPGQGGRVTGRFVVPPKKTTP